VFELAQRASSEIDAGEGAHKFVSGPLERLWQGGGKTQEFTQTGLTTTAKRFSPTTLQSILDNWVPLGA